MTPTPTPPVQPQSNALNITKMAIGGAVSVGCLALVALNSKLGIGLTPDTCLVLIGVALGSGSVAGHGALKTPVGDAS